MLTEEQFQAWKGHPVTKPFLEFLRAVREDLKERWAEGQEMEPTDHAIAIVYGDIIGLEYDRDIRPFYERKFGITEESEDEDVQE
jgi:hypothetical protein